MIHLDSKVFQAMQGFAESAHPKEVIMLLRGTYTRQGSKVTDFLLPPFGHGSHGYASFPSHMLPIDFTIIGTAHSHPSGYLNPSTGDLHHFYGKIMIIIGPPYDRANVAAWNRDGESVQIKITELKP